MKAEEHATLLARQNWQQFSDSLNGTLSTARTWRILKALMDPNKTILENNKAIYRLVHQHEGPDAELLEKVRVKCYRDSNPAAYTDGYRAKKTI